MVFNDKSYTIEASVVAKSLEKARDVLLASKKVNEGVEPVSVDAAKASGTYKSWIEVEQTWSESGTKTFKKEALLKHYVLFPQEIFRFDAGENTPSWTTFPWKFRPIPKSGKKERRLTASP